MPTREQLHHLVERLPESELVTAHRLLTLLSVDSALYSLLTAPFDDEPYTEEQQRADQEARTAVERGERCLTSEELIRELGQ